jgi:hypothetical protein
MVRDTGCQRTIHEIREMIEAHGIAPADRHDLPDSPLTFPDGCHWRNEISGIGGVDELQELLKIAERYECPVHRVIIGAASNWLRGDLRRLAELSREHRFEAVMDAGPKSNRDYGRHAETPFGRWGGWRVRGADQLSYLVKYVFRAVAEGVRGFLLFDEGALMLLARMRQAGDLPADTIFKMSYTAGHRNPAGAKVLETLGADSFNPVTDLSPAMLAAIRQTVKIPMDVVMHAWETLGSVVRAEDAPEIVRVAAPCYLKQELHGQSERKIRNCLIIRELIEDAWPGLKCSAPGPDDLHLGCAD